MTHSGIVSPAPAHPVRWGIIGPGNIAKSFVAGLRVVDGAQVVAVASRDPARAAAFVVTSGGRACADIDDLLGDPTVDAVYVATPHPQHHAIAKRCLEAGKAVLCEKPITITAAECEDLIRTARERRVFLMEAMWTRFLPAIGQVRTWIAAGAIGEVRLMSADFGFRCPWDPTNRLLDPAQAGGAILDVGVYVLALADMIFGGAPQRVTGLAHLGTTGVDEQAAVILGYAGGGLASLHCAVRTDTEHTARIHGTAGSITIPSFWRATEAVLQPAGGKEERFVRPHAANGYEWQADEVARCLASGLTESPIMPLDASLAVQRTIDNLRRQWGMPAMAKG